MSDNKTVNSVPVATREVTYSGDAAQNVQVVGLATFSGADDAKTATDVTGDSYGLDVDVNKLPQYLTDTFGKLQTVDCINDIDVQFFRDDPANLVNVTTANGGTATRTTGLMQLATSTATNGSVIAVSRDTVMYRSGGEVYVLFTTAFLDGGVAGCNQRIGLYDANNGFYIGYEGATFGLVARSGGVDGSQVAKASWNGDTLTGAAGSRFTRGGTPESINLANLNIWRIRFGWLGAAPIKLEVVSPDGEWVLCHTIRQPNNSATPSIQSTDLPITADLTKTSGATTVRLNTACWGAGLTYSKVDVVGSNTLGTAANSVVNYNTQAIHALQVRCGTGTTGTMIFEGTVDGSSWVTMPNVWLIGAAGTADTAVAAAVTPTSGNTYRIPVANFRSVRVRTATTLGAGVVLHVQGEGATSLVGFSGAGIGKIEGGVAHDGADAGPPVKVGMKAIAHGTNPTAVAAADRTDWYANRHGIPFMVGGHPNIITVSARITGSNTDVALAPTTVNAGTKVVVTRLTVAISNATTVNVGVRIGFGATTLAIDSTTGATGILVDSDGFPPGGGANVGTGGGILGVGGDGEELRITNDAPTSGAIHVSYSYYTIES